MQKYQLIKKDSAEVRTSSLAMRSLRNLFFFRYDDVNCFKLDSHIDYMLFNDISEMDIWLAERETNVSHFFCRFFGEVGDKSETTCGKFCQGYEPRNGKSGACKHYGYTYQQTNECFTLKLTI